MNLAFCLFKYFPYGGLQRDFVRIADECLKRSHKIHVYTMQWEGPNTLNLPITVIPLKEKQNHVKSKAFAEKLHTLLNKTSYDLIVGFNKIPGLDVYYAADTCYQARARQKHGFLYRLTPRYRTLVEFETSVFGRDKKTEILLLSSLQQDDFIKHYQTPRARFHLLPPGISKDRRAPLNAAEIRCVFRKKMGIAQDERLLLMIGSGFKTKGLDRILKGFAALPLTLKNRTHLFVVGQDNPKSFERLARQLKIQDRLQFLGGRDDIPELLLAGDLLVHPAYNENTGTVLLEALIAGLPVLTTDVCGYAHFVETARAGRVLSSPFEQIKFNSMLEEMLVSKERNIWQQNALNFAKDADIYSLPERAVDLLEKVRC